ncbi:MAG: Rieske (2Fe-2S) protein [Gemmatimonadota bacterium]|nr:MAG: Rieske (2Fe-2S) protein [Gemmatimonadota bacterium]
MSKSPKQPSRKRPKGTEAAAARTASAIAPPDSEESTVSSPRRRFLGRLWLGLGGLAVVEFLWIAIDFLRPRTPLTASQTDIIVAGPVDAFEPSSVTAFQQGKFYLSRLADGGFLALSRECTHLGCTVPWIEEEGRFVCPCHSSSYDHTGEVLQAPAPRPLDLYPVRIENGIVKVDVGSPLRRKSFDRRQVTRL